jgi:hypothetical protein
MQQNRYRWPLMLKHSEAGKVLAERDEYGTFDVIIDVLEGTK